LSPLLTQKVVIASCNNELKRSLSTGCKTSYNPLGDVSFNNA